MCPPFHEGLHTHEQHCARKEGRTCRSWMQLYWPGSWQRSSNSSCKQGHLCIERMEGIWTIFASEPALTGGLTLILVGHEQPMQSACQAESQSVVALSRLSRKQVWQLPGICPLPHLTAAACGATGASKSVAGQCLACQVGPFCYLPIPQASM